MSSSEVPPGWRHAQGDPPGTERYWDGSRWQGDPRPIGGSQEPPGEAPTSTPASRASDPFAASARPAAASSGPRPQAQSSASSGGGAPSVQAPFSANDAKGFLSRLFDLSFQSFITTSIIKVLYVLFIIVAGLASLGFIAVGFASNAGVGVVTLILSPLIFLLYVIMARVYLEIVIVLFRIHDQTAETARNTRK
ncbi:MAG: DUF4282 domain-containing protein [Dehalococcoidia bacterium]